MSAQIERDGRTVWVHAGDGSCVGRFSRFGIDLHTDATTQMAGGEQCLDCTTGLPGMAEWRRFQDGLLRHYGITAGDEHMPDFLQPGAK